MAGLNRSTSYGVDPSELGLKAHPELGTLLQFSAAGSRASRESLNRLAAVAAHECARTLIVELTVNSGSPLQRRLGVRHVPSVYLINQRGVVTHHWARPPQISELREALGSERAGMLRPMEQVDAAIQVLLGVTLIVLVLMHSGKDTGLSGMFNPAGGSYGGTAVMERNLTRLTVAVAIAFVINTMLLGYLLNHG